MPNKQPEKEILIFVDRLKDGQPTEIKEVMPADSMQVDESELRFGEPIQVEGEAYLAGSELIVRVAIRTTAQMVCKICNEFTPIEINVPDLYHVEALEKIKTGIISLVPVVREAVLLELPLVAECEGGKCPERGVMERYCARPEEEELTQPFQGLTLDK